MAKIDLKFLDAYDDAFVQVLEVKGCIDITTYNPYSLELSTVMLDKSTAIKFAKTLRTEINKIQ